MGGQPPMVFRQQWAEWCQQEKTELWLRYEWIKHPGFYGWLIDEEEIDWHEGTEGITFWIDTASVARPKEKET